jgi:hypothetical protein
MAAALQTFKAANLDDDRNQHIAGDLIEVFYRLTFSGSYPAGGDVVDFRDYFKSTGKGIVFIVDLPATVAGYMLEYDYANRKVLIRQGDNSNASAGPGIQIPAAAYPAALTSADIRGMVIGR